MSYPRVTSVPSTYNRSIGYGEAAGNIEDAYKWSLQTVDALRSGDLSRIDLDELINEVGSIPSGLRRELVSVLRQIIEGLLVLEYTDAGEKEKADSDLQLSNHTTGL